MASATMAPSTPSPPPSSSVRTPPAPRLGFHDSWEPFSPRKSARISAQRTSARTPSPPPSSRRQLGSPRASRKATSQDPEAMVSPATSPRKKRAAPASSFKDKPLEKSVTSSALRASGMLPTPSKTPQKPPNAKTAANIQSFARNLFPAEDAAVSSPRKKRAKKYSGMTLESFTAEEVEEPVEIYTDSHERVPSKDERESNPFYGAANQESKRRSKRRQVMIPGEGAQSVDEASRREDGMVYVFRGKKFFRKFSENEDEETQEFESDVEDHLTRPLTRSSIKPRLLFPTHKTQEMLEEEEATTDVEDLHMDENPAMPQTPVKSKAGKTQTPEAPKFAPVSPPDTKRTTRSTNKLADSTPMKRTGKKSPFDSWRRTKESAGQSSAKRAGEPLAAASTKRARA